MWIIKKFNDPGLNYGKYQVGYFEPIAGDHVFRGIGPIYTNDRDGLGAAGQLCSYLNGGLDSSAAGAILRIANNSEYTPRQRPTHTSDGYPL